MMLVFVFTAAAMATSMSMAQEDGSQVVVVHGGCGNGACCNGGAATGTAGGDETGVALFKGSDTSKVTEWSEGDPKYAVLGQDYATSWDEMDAILEYLVTAKELNTDDRTEMCWIEPALATEEDRMSVASMAIESLQFDEVCLVNRAVIALYLSHKEEQLRATLNLPPDQKVDEKARNEFEVGKWQVLKDSVTADKLTGVVLEIAERHSYAVAVLDGKVQRHTAVRVEAGTRDVTDCMAAALATRGIGVCPNREHELILKILDGNVGRGECAGTDTLMFNLADVDLKVFPDLQLLGANDPVTSRASFMVGYERYSCPQLLFAPPRGGPGIARAVLDSVFKLDEVTMWNKVLANVAVIGDHYFSQGDYFAVSLARRLKADGFDSMHSINLQHVTQDPNAKQAKQHTFVHTTMVDDKEVRKAACNGELTPIVPVCIDSTCYLNTQAFNSGSKTWTQAVFNKDKDVSGGRRRMRNLVQVGVDGKVRS